MDDLPGTTGIRRKSCQRNIGWLRNENKTDCVKTKAQTGTFHHQIRLLKPFITTYISRQPPSLPLNALSLPLFMNLIDAVTAAAAKSFI